MKNHLIIILLLLSFGAPFYGTFFFLKYQRHIIKKEIKKQIITGIDKSELVHLKFSGSEMKSKLRWEHEKEFEFNGEMYDVVEKETIGDTAHYWCWLDHKETKLNQLLQKLVADNLKNNTLNKKRQKSMNNFLKALYPIELFQWFSYIFSDKQIFAKFISNYSSRVVPVASPPPELANYISMSFS